MPAFIWLIASGWQDDPDKFALAIELTRITFPYLIFISLVSLLSGVLNSLTRFAAAAFAPALLNLALIVALLVVPDRRTGDGAGDGDRGDRRRRVPARLVLGRDPPRRASSCA